MSSINETAYPQLRSEIAEKDLLALFTPSRQELQFIANAYCRATTQALIAIQLKVPQRLGYFSMMVEVPEHVVRYICKRMRIPVFSNEALKAYDESGSKSIHQRLLRDFVGLRVLGADGQAWLEGQATKGRPDQAGVAGHYQCAAGGVAPPSLRVAGLRHIVAGGSFGFGGLMAAWRATGGQGILLQF